MQKINVLNVLFLTIASLLLLSLGACSSDNDKIKFEVTRPIKITTEWDSNHIVIELAYDETGKLVKIINKNTVASTTDTRTLEYLRLEDYTTIQVLARGASGVNTFRYNIPDIDPVIKVLDAANNEVEKLTIDAAGRLTRKEVDGEVTTFSYVPEEINLRKTVSEPSGKSVEYSYENSRGVFSASGISPWIIFSMLRIENSYQHSPSTISVGENHAAATLAGEYSVKEFTKGDFPRVIYYTPSGGRVVRQEIEYETIIRTN